MIKFRFNIIKTTQAAARFLKNNGGNMDSLKLMKLLYLVDRKALGLWERPITGDDYVSMSRGPVLRNVHNIIKNKKPIKENLYWFELIVGNVYNLESQLVLVTDSPGATGLSKREVRLIDNFSTDYKDFSPDGIVEYCHNNLPEWEEVNSGSKVIKIETILRYLNKTSEEIIEIDEEVSSLNALRDRFSSTKE